MEIIPGSRDIGNSVPLNRKPGFMVARACSDIQLKIPKLAGTIFLVLSALVCMPGLARGTYLVFTTEVCWPCGEHFQATWQGKDYGTPYVVEKLEQFGLKGTFFVSPLCPPNLTDTMVSNLAYLASRGHDLELDPFLQAIDPTRLQFTMYSIEERRKILEVALDNIKRAGAPPPVAHRANEYAIDQETLRLLPEFGIRMDSSILPMDPASKVPLPEVLANRFVKIGGAYQLPITLIKMVPLLGYAGMTSLDIEKTIWEEQEEALNQIAEHGLPVATYFIHFASFYYHGPDKVTGLNEENISKLDKVLKHVTADKRFKVVTARELWKLFEERPQALQGPSFVPYTGLWLTYLKAWNHFSGHGIANKIVVVAPLGLAFLMLLGVLFLLRRKGLQDHKQPGSYSLRQKP
jgi:hypothetical protein